MAENKKIVVVNLQKLEVAPIGAGGAEGSVFEEVPVVHEDTFTYEDEDPEVKDYKDVAGNTYYSSKSRVRLRSMLLLVCMILRLRLNSKVVSLRRGQRVSRAHGSVPTM